MSNEIKNVARTARPGFMITTVAGIIALAITVYVIVSGVKISKEVAVEKDRIHIIKINAERKANSEREAKKKAAAVKAAKRRYDAQKAANNKAEAEKKAAEDKATRDSMVWSSWHSVDRPGGDGDFELFRMHKANKIEVCAKPVKIQCRTVGTHMDWPKAGNVYKCDLVMGGSCRNSQQPAGIRCKDYEMRFACPK